MSIILVSSACLIVVTDDIGQVLVLAYNRCYSQDIALVPCAYAQGGRYTGEREVGVIDRYACQDDVAVVRYPYLELDISGYYGIGSRSCVGI